MHIDINFRPPFSLIETWLTGLHSFPTGSYASNGSKDVKNYILNNNIDLSVLNTEVLDTKANVIDGNISKDTDNASDGCEVLNLTPKSQFLRRDFSETGERLRNSFRARRHKKSIQNKKHDQENTENNVLLCDTSESEPLSLIEITKEAKQSLFDVEKTLNKVNQKLENDHRINQFDNDAFVIKMGDGVFSIQEVKKLENFSDLDSSCDTSLNFIESSLSGDNNNFDSQSLEYNSYNGLVENHEKKLQTNDSLDSRVNKQLKKDLNRRTNSQTTTIVKRSIPESKVIKSNRSISREEKLKETKLNPIKKYPNIKIDVDKPLIAQKRSKANIKENSKQKSFGKHTGLHSTTLNSIPKLQTHTLEKLTISEKMTESARAKIKAKIPINASKTTLSTTSIREKNKCKTVNK